MGEMVLSDVALAGEHWEFAACTPKISTTLRIPDVDYPTIDRESIRVSNP